MQKEKVKVRSQVSVWALYVTEGGASLCRASKGAVRGIDVRIRSWYWLLLMIRSSLLHTRLFSC